MRPQEIEMEYVECSKCGYEFDEEEDYGTLDHHICPACYDNETIELKIENLQDLIADLAYDLVEDLSDTDRYILQAQFNATQLQIIELQDRITTR
jgi:Zn ribbon nucleic-acid-binding protein